MKIVKIHFRAVKYCIFTLTILFLLVTSFSIGNSFIEQFFNKQNHTRVFDIKMNDGAKVTFSVPSYLHTLPESEKKQTADVFTHELLNTGLYTTDRKLNQYYYQVQGVDFVIGQAPSYISNIPAGIIKQGPQEINIPSGKALLYIYPGADGDGHGRGELGSVHQGLIVLPENTGVAFTCYDHSSGAKISARCTQIMKTIFQTIHLSHSLLPGFFE